MKESQVIINPYAQPKRSTNRQYCYLAAVKPMPLTPKPISVITLLQFLIALPILMLIFYQAWLRRTQTEKIQIETLLQEARA